MTGTILAGTLAFAWTCLLIELTPGPNMTTLAVLSASRGRRAGIAAVLGVALGLSIVGVLAGLGLAAAIDQSPLLYEALRWAGVGYLLWLAWEGWQDAEIDPPHLGSATTDADLRHFRQGLITNLLNPKAAVFYVSILPTFLDPERPLLRQSLLLTAIYVAIATAIHLAIVMAADHTRTLLGDPNRNRLIRRALAVLLAIVALWLAWSTRR
ncbi:MAG: LysE family translocator [Hyphomicrobiaceae bacterium]